MGSPQGIYEESSTQEYPIGTKREFEDGRVFRYASFGAATAAGVLVSQDVSATAVVEIENVATAAAVGATEVILTDSGTLGSATANQYAGAYLHTVDDAGEGYTYRIKSNTAASKSSSASNKTPRANRTKPSESDPSSAAISSCSRAKAMSPVVR